MPTYGIEEEVFIVEPDRPSLNSLFYLAKLLWRDPRQNYFYTASNFARGHDLLEGIMSGVEVATSVHSNVDELLSELVERRQQLCEVSDGLIVPIGSLIDQNSPTNSCAFQVHIGTNDQDRAYSNFIHFLPVLSVLMLNSPYTHSSYFGQSYRMAHSYAIGPVTIDKTYRFQDVIIAKRLGTIELRVFDPTWDIDRIRVLLNAVDAIASLEMQLPANTSHYNEKRNSIAKEGFLEEFENIYQELAQISEVPRNLLEQTSSDQIARIYDSKGLLETYSALDNGYRHGLFEPRQIVSSKANALRSAIGFAGYYIPKLPYVIWKFLKES